MVKSACRLRWRWKWKWRCRLTIERLQCGAIVSSRSAFPSGWVADTSELTRGCENKRGQDWLTSHNSGGGERDLNRF